MYDMFGMPPPPFTYLFPFPNRQKKENWGKKKLRNFLFFEMLKSLKEKKKQIGK